MSGNSYLGSKILNYYFKSNYNHEKANLFAADRIVYFPLENVVPEQRKSYLPAKDYQFQTGISLQHFALDKERGKNGWAKPFGFNYYVKYSYLQQFNSGHQDLQRNTNDWLSPLTQQAADWCIDKQNSYHTTRLERVQQLDLEMESSYKDIALRLVPTLYLYNRQLHDYRNQTNQSVNNHTFVCNLAGELLYSYKNNDFCLGEVGSTNFRTLWTCSMFATKPTRLCTIWAILSCIKRVKLTAHCNIGSEPKKSRAN